MLSTPSNVPLVHQATIGGVAYIETYVEACRSLFKVMAVAAKGGQVPPISLLLVNATK